ncbi:MAG: peptide ABC transporter substrate-binding protein, partial [Acutalibacteraceae bacterium]
VLKALSLILAVLTVLSLSACGDSYQDAIIYFEIPEQPYTLDPQTASTDSELAIVGNIFEGLLRKNASGAIVCGVSESFEKDGLTYTFKLRKDTVWSNEEPLTADDFVFAFRRAVSPETKAPFASRLFPIENAKDIYEGKKNADTLGVTAPDSYTLVIKLAYEDGDFEEALTTSVAMPCNRKFFEETGGKYGLNAENTISCGSYKLTKWNKESFGIRLYSNSLYTGTFTAKNAAVYITKDKDESAIDRLIGNNVDIAFIDSSLTDTAHENGLKTIDYQNICWFLTISSDFSEALRKSLAMLVGSEVYGGDLKTGYTPADSIFPAAVNENTGSSGMTFYNAEAAKALFAKETAKLAEKKFPSGVKLYYYDNGVIKPVITDIVGHWQNNLGAFVNIEAVSSAEKLVSELKNQTLDMAVFPVRADSPDIEEYLSNFGVQANGQSPSEIQTRVLKSSSIFPIAFQNTTIAYSTALNDVFTNFGNGYIDFSFIVKTE